jgi:2-polyprenyl-6-methoxyphenol hydroxylase-like FAD-dependent oxidoreductase
MKSDAPIVIVGAGPVGLTLALELARLGTPSLVLDAKPSYRPEGSKAMVLARHALDAFASLGAPELGAKAIVLERARTFYRDLELFCVEFPPPAPGETPLFGNLQQTHVERVLLARIEAAPLVELRWGAGVEGLRQDDGGVTLALAGGAAARGAYVVGCDGSRSAVRDLLGIGFPGRSPTDRFLIADVRASLPFPNERRFFFDPPFNRGRQVLIHPQPDGEWRVDWQVPSATDVDTERTSGRLDRRIRDTIGDHDYELAWLTSYRFHQRVADRFRAGNVFLAGDAAHLFAPFGARGLNSGVEDARNLAWRLALAAHGDAGSALLDAYEVERRAAALVNLRVTSRTMRFMAPPTPFHRGLRNFVLRASVRSGRARRLVNSGRLAEPSVYGDRPVPLGRVAPREWTTREAYEVGPFRIVEGHLVRPDGYVAVRVDGRGPRTVADAVALL